MFNCFLLFSVLNLLSCSSELLVKFNRILRVLHSYMVAVSGRAGWQVRAKANIMLDNHLTKHLNITSLKSNTGELVFILNKEWYLLIIVGTY